MEQNKSIVRKGHPKECEGNFHDGMNGIWKCWKCGMIGGGFNDIPQQNKSKEVLKKEGMIDFLKNILPYWESDDLDDYMYIVHHYDLERVATKLLSLVQQSKEEGRQEAHNNWLSDLTEMGMIIGVREGGGFKEYGKTEVIESLSNTPNNK